MDNNLRQEVIQLINERSMTEQRVRLLIAQQAAPSDKIAVIDDPEEFDANMISLPGTQVSNDGQSWRYVRVAMALFQDYLQGTKEDWLAQMDAHPPYVGTDNYWYVWNPTAGQYEKSSVYAKGDDLHWDEMSQAEKNDLAQRVLNGLIMASVSVCESVVDELT